MDKKVKIRKIEDLDEAGVINLLEKWEMDEFVDYVRVKHLDGVKLLVVSEGIVKLWRPKCNAKRFMEFIAQIKLDPQRYLEKLNDTIETRKTINVEAQYQTVNVKRMREQIASTSVGVEDILKKIAPPKSFLYRNQSTNTDVKKIEKPVTSYTPMDGVTRKKSKRHFRIRSYEHFDIKHFRFTKETQSFNDRGYYTVKNDPKHNIQKTCKKNDGKTRYRSLSTTEEFEKYPEEHYYEDLNYNDIKKEPSSLKEVKSNVKPTMTKIHELFSSIKLPFFKKSDDTNVAKDTSPENVVECETNGHIYENGDSLDGMYDTIDLKDPPTMEKQTKLEVEDYLEPVHLSKDYCDVGVRQRDDSILGYILSIFESFGIRRETTDVTQDNLTEKNAVEKPPPDVSVETKNDIERPKSKMADRPLPVPVENEPYFMDIGRTEAEDLLRGYPDGAFVLRPSTQPNHAYTLTVSCSNSVHNVGIRRRTDGRLALGFARRGERSFDTVASLLRHHRKHRLLLLANGAVCGATILTETPQYYQTPSGLPLSKV